MIIKKLAVASSLAVAAIGFGSQSASAAPLVTGGLVNVTVTEVIDDVTVTVSDVNVGVNAALAVAANVCDTNIAVLARQLRNGSATCTNDLSGQTATLTQA